MKINFEFLLENNMDSIDLLVLQSIRQKEEYHNAFPEKVWKMVELGLVENEGRKLTKSGISFMETIEEPGVTEEVNELVEKAVELYEERSKPIGKRRNVEINIAWFMSETNFKKEVVLRAIEDYLQTADKYTMSLEYLIWKSPNVFTTAKSLKDSKLFDFIASKSGINTSFYFDTKKNAMNKIIRWLMWASRMPEMPKSANPNFSFTGSIAGDAERLKFLKKELYSLISRG